METSKYTLNIYPRAQADLEDIFRYISEELCNPNAAATLIDSVEGSTQACMFESDYVSACQKQFNKG